jgi:hypothetical protein
MLDDKPSIPNQKMRCGVRNSVGIVSGHFDKIDDYGFSEVSEGSDNSWISPPIRMK